MGLLLKIFLITYLAVPLEYKSFEISNYEILRICRKERKEKACIKRLKLNRDLLEAGKPIEIPVIPYRNK
tara:strand:- start:388 stop:597 length:210 start_codon:yes stop_codon:yes gene_type:complete